MLEHTLWVEVNPGALVTWQLQPTESGCTLVLTHSLTMDDVRAAAASVAAGDDLTDILSRNAAGWHHLLDMLEAALDRRTLEWSDEAEKDHRSDTPGSTARPSPRTFSMVNDPSLQSADLEDYRNSPNATVISNSG